MPGRHRDVLRLGAVRFAVDESLGPRRGTERERRRADHDRRIDAAVVVGTATLTLSATPWAETFVDGKSYGTKPQNITVPAGHHMIVFVYSPPDSAPRKQTFSIDLA